MITFFQIFILCKPYYSLIIRKHFAAQRAARCMYHRIQAVHNLSAGSVFSMLSAPNIGPPK